MCHLLGIFSFILSHMTISSSFIWVTDRRFYIFLLTINIFLWTNVFIRYIYLSIYQLDKQCSILPPVEYQMQLQINFLKEKTGKDFCNLKRCSKINSSKWHSAWYQMYLLVLLHPSKDDTFKLNAYCVQLFSKPNSGLFVFLSSKQQENSHYPSLYFWLLCLQPFPQNSCLFCALTCLVNCGTLYASVSADPKKKNQISWI